MNDAAAGADVPAARCFIALLPDAASRQSLAQCRESIERSSAGAARGVRFVDAAALHLTLRFLGDTTPTQRETLQRALPKLARALPHLDARRFAVWPNRARPRLLVLEFTIDAPLAQLAGACETQARDAGFAPEARGFRAHVTLARLRPGCVFGTLPEPPAALRFAAIALLQSHLEAPAAQYTELARAMITRAVG